MKNRNETFVTIEGFENYSISNKGKVMSYAYSEQGKLLKPQKDGMGYLHVRLYDGTDERGRYDNGDKKPKLEKVHRLVATHFIPYPDTDRHYEVNHIDGDKQNNDVTNLEWLTRAENIQHAWNNGLNTKGATLGGNKRSRPVKITNEDGSIEYFYSQTEAAIVKGCSPITIMMRVKKGKDAGFGKLGFVAEHIEEIPQEELYKRLDDVEDALREYRDKYYGRFRKTNYSAKII